jgi:hypothetical protein
MEGRGLFVYNQYQVATDFHPLAGLRRYEDPGAGIYEEFLDRRLGPGRALALLSGPLAEPRTSGWVICPTIGPEQGNLRRLEAIVARRLSAAGFPVLRVRPDADPLHGEIGLGTRLAEVEEAVGLVGERVDGVGVVGTLFGATIAVLVAERLGLPAVALIEPIGRGRQYARELLNREAIAQLMGPESGDAAQGRHDELSTTGETVIRGLRLSSEGHDAISAVNLAQDLQTFSGRSLLIAISPTGKVPTGLGKLHARLVELGGDATLETVADPLYAPLGEYYYRDAGLLRVDTRLALDQKLGETIAAWALSGAET